MNSIGALDSWTPDRLKGKGLGYAIHECYIGN